MLGSTSLKQVAVSEVDQTNVSGSSDNYLTILNLGAHSFLPGTVGKSDLVNHHKGHLVNSFHLNHSKSIPQWQTRYRTLA